MQITCSTCGAANPAPTPGVAAVCAQCGSSIAIDAPTEVAPESTAPDDFFAQVVAGTDALENSATDEHPQLELPPAPPEAEMERVLGSAEPPPAIAQGPEATPVARPVSRTATSLPTLDALQAHPLEPLPLEATDASSVAQAARDDAWRRWHSGTVAVKLALAAVVLALAVGGLIVGMSLGGSDLPYSAWVLSTHPLLTLPDPEGETELGGPLTRGAEVLCLEHLDSFTLVRDRRGRAGFVRAEALSRERPTLDAEKSSFPDCYPRFDEADTAGCLRFAQAMHKRCVERCGTDVKELCTQTCDGRLDECKMSCEHPRALALPECPACDCPPSAEPASGEEEMTEASDDDEKSKTKRRTKKKRKKR